RFDSIDDYNDVAIKNLYKEERAAGKSHEEIMKIIWKNGRDNSRTPMQWNTETNSGFTTGKPWMKVNPNYQEINVEAELNDADSILNYYKQLILLRRDHDALIYGNYDLILENHDHILDRKSTRLNSSHVSISYAVFCLKK